MCMRTSQTNDSFEDQLRDENAKAASSRWRAFKAKQAAEAERIKQERRKRFELTEEQKAQAQRLADLMNGRQKDFAGNLI